MTDKARELLEMALECWELQLFGAANCGFKTFEEIRAYLAKPEVKREPVTYDESEAGFYSTFLGCTVFDHFMAGVRFAEKHHGIGGGDD